MMLDAGIGILRTMPDADPDTVAAFRSRAAALGIPWLEVEPYGAYLRRLDTDDPAQLAIMYAAATLFRGAGYTAFHGAPPEHPEQAALAVCLAVSGGGTVPLWLREALPLLPLLLAATNRKAAAASHPGPAHAGSPCRRRPGIGRRRHRLRSVQSRHLVLSAEPSAPTPRRRPRAASRRGQPRPRSPPERRATAPASPGCARQQGDPRCASHSRGARRG